MDRAARSRKINWERARRWIGQHGVGRSAERGRGDGQGSAE